MLPRSKKFPVLVSKIIHEFSGELRLKVPQDLAYFEGHFTDVSVVPGVVQLHWVVEYVVQFFKIIPKVHKGAQIKFMSLMKPNDTPTLSLKIDPEKSLIFYKYEDNDITYSSGRLSYDL